MGAGAIVEKARIEKWPDEEVVARVLQGDTALFEIIMRRYNQRLYRVALSILGDEAEAEDVMQDAYVRAYEHLDQFAGRAAFSTWLTSIAVHEALARAERRRHLQDLEAMVELARRLLEANKERHGHVTTGNLARGAEHWVYGRAGRPCRRCGTMIRRADQGAVTEERVTFWCPSCQPA